MTLNDEKTCWRALRVIGDVDRVQLERSDDGLDFEVVDAAYAPDEMRDLPPGSGRYRFARSESGAFLVRPDGRRRRERSIDGGATWFKYGADWKETVMAPAVVHIIRRVAYSADGPPPAPCCTCGGPWPCSLAVEEKAPKAAVAEGKVPLGLVAPDFVLAVARVLAFGATKYRAWSWARGKEWSLDYDAAQRHLLAWWGGEDLDPESGLPHLAHAATDLMFLVVSAARGLGEDDRPRLGARP